MSRKVFIKWILEGKQPPQKTFCESGAERKAKSPVKRFYCSFTIYMKVFANITHLDQNRQKCNPSIYSNPPLNLFRSIFQHSPLPPLINAYRLFGTQEYGLFVPLFQWFFFVVAILLLFISFCIWKTFLRNSLFFILVIIGKDICLCFQSNGCIDWLVTALFLRKAQFIILSRKHGISFQKNKEKLGMIKSAKAFLITDGKSKSVLCIIYNKA